MFDGAPPSRSGPLRIAIISTYDEMCGIAGYTRALELQLRSGADVTVFDLDQYLLRSPHANVQRLADRHIKDIAVRLQDFDSVNIQLEYGTLGRTPKQIMRRLRRLVTAATAISITFHTILGHDSLNWQAIGQSLITGRIVRLFQIIGGFRIENLVALDDRPVLCASIAKFDVRTHRGQQVALRLNVSHLRNVFEHDRLVGEKSGGHAGERGIFCAADADGAE